MAKLFTDGFHYAVGIEDTFVPQAGPGQRALDEYELTQHYQRWHEDFGLAHASGATAIRYGFPWYRLEPERNRFVWDWADAVVERLQELGLEAIVDLMHYGTPLWLDNQFLNHDYPQRVAEYAARLAERYRGVLRAYTPLNEPTVNALFCGARGTWPPYLVGDDGYVKLVRALVRGFVATQRAVAEATASDATFVHVEATLRFAGDESEALHHERAKALLIEDLLTGKVDDEHPLAAWLARHGFADDDLAWCAGNQAQPDVMGVNYYPHLSTTELVADELVERWPRRQVGADGLAEMIRLFAGRYGRPVFITETSMTGTPEERIAWLDESLACIAELRGEGVDVVGYTWWPLFSLVDWEYRSAVGSVEPHLVPMGMWDLVADSVGLLERVETPVVAAFRRYASGSGPAPSAARQTNAVGSRPVSER